MLVMEISKAGHTKPDKAKSDAASIMPIDWLEDLLKACKKIFAIVHG